MPGPPAMWSRLTLTACSSRPTPAASGWCTATAADFPSLTWTARTSGASQPAPMATTTSMPVREILRDRHFQNAPASKLARDPGQLVRSGILRQVLHVRTEGHLSHHYPARRPPDCAGHHRWSLLGRYAVRAVAALRLPHARRRQG